MSRDPAAVPSSSGGHEPAERTNLSQRPPHSSANGTESGAERRPFRAVDVLSGSIDQRAAAKPGRARKQISAQLEPGQLRLLGELHARLNATASERIEKSDLVGLGIELLAAALAYAGQDLAPAPGGRETTTAGSDPPAVSTQGLGSVAAIRSYVHTYVRVAGTAFDRASHHSGQPGRRGDS